MGGASRDEAMRLEDVIGATRGVEPYGHCTITSKLGDIFHVARGKRTGNGVI